MTCALGLSAQAAPAAGASAIVLESHVGQRSGEAAAALAPLLDELEQRGFAARRAAIVQGLRGRIGWPGVSDAGATAAGMAQQVELGLDAFTAGNYEQAQDILARAVQQLQRNPERAASAGAMFKALVALALAQGRLGNAAASAATMTELIRAFPARAVSRAQYGPEAEEVYRTVLDRTRSIGRGRLSIATGDERVKIFVDGQLRGTGKTSLGDLLPGTYQVFLQPPTGEGRRYEVPVGAGDDGVLEVEWPIEAALTVSDAWVGFQFASQGERSKESGFAAALARRWGRASIVVVGTARLHGAPAVIATLVDARGEVVRSAMVPSGRDPSEPRSLAAYIADGTPSPAVTMIGPADRPHAAARGRSSLAGKLLVGGGLAAIAAGAVVLMFDEDPGNAGADHTITRFYRDTAPWGVGVGIAGLAAVGVGAWLLLHPERGPSGPVISLGRSGGGIGWAGAF